jgi:DNA-directed RNA polymerase specialized sigma24 family protein
MLRKLISFLPVSYSEVITLVDLQEMDHDEAAQLLEIDKNLLKVRLHRARARLEQLIENNMEYFK